MVVVLMQGCQATGKSSKSQASRARTVLRGTSCPQRRPVDQPPHPEGSHTTVVPFYPAPLLTALVFLSTPPWPDTGPGNDPRAAREPGKPPGRAQEAAGQDGEGPASPPACGAPPDSLR